METARDLNMETDEMQLVVSALRGVEKKLWKWQKRTSRSSPVSFPSRARKCASGCISVPVSCRTIGTGGLFPTRSLLERYSIRLRIWKKCWRRITRAVEQDKDNKRILLNRTTALGQRYICFKCCF